MSYTDIPGHPSQSGPENSKFTDTHAHASFIPGLVKIALIGQAVTDKSIEQIYEQIYTNLLNVCMICHWVTMIILFRLILLF